MKPVEPKLDPLQTNTNNVLPGYSETFGPPSWVSPPSVCAIIARIVSTPTMEELNEAYWLEELMMGKILAHIAAIKHTTDVDVITWKRLEAACLVSLH